MFEQKKKKFLGDAQVDEFLLNYDSSDFLHLVIITTGLLKVLNWLIQL